MTRYAIVATPWGCVGFVVTPRGLARTFLTRRDAAGAHRLLRRRFPDARRGPGLLPSLQRQVRDYFAGRLVRFRARPDLSCLTAFQRRVLKECARIGYGRTMTYGQLARQVGKPRAARAVGQALARNPVPLIIPCHRVIGGHGRLGGYSAERGVALKRRLLRLEKEVGQEKEGGQSPFRHRCKAGQLQRRSPRARCADTSRGRKPRRRMPAARGGCGTVRAGAAPPGLRP